MELSNPKLKNPLYLRRDLAKSEKQTKISALKKFLVSHDVFTIFTAVKYREIIINLYKLYKQINLYK